MRPGEIVTIALFFCALAGLTAISSKKIGEADKESALAAAIKAEYEWFLGDKIYAKSLDPLIIETLCLESREAFDHESLARHLSNTVVRPVPFRSCRREIEEGEFGMFTAMLRHFGPRGERAGHFEVVKIKCPTTSSCAIDIDKFGSGDRHFVERCGQDWQVVKSQNRWVV